MSVTFVIVVPKPLFDDDPGLLQAVEDFAIEQFVTQLAVEALGRAEKILAERQRIKRETIANRRLQHRLQAA